MVKHDRRMAPSRRCAWLLAVPLVLLSTGCSQWSWNPMQWDLFGKKTEAPPPTVEMLAIESRTANPAGERFEQHWDGARLVVDIHSTSGIGRATLKPRDQGWPLRLAFRLHLSAVEGFEVKGAQSMRFSLGSGALTEPALIDLPYGIVTKDSPQLDIQWVDRYR